MKLVRLRQQKDRLPIIEVEQEFLFASTVLAHVERLARVRVLAKRASIFADSFEAIFEYDGQRFAMSQPFGCIMINALDAAASTEIIHRLADHVDQYRTVWPQQLAWAIVRYFFLPATIDSARSGQARSHAD